jgi:carboxyl-terminal processing protease
MAHGARFSLFVLILGGCVLAGCPCLCRAAEQPKKAPAQDDYELYKTLVDAIDQVERNYVKDIDRRELFEAAIKGVLNKLDPYSSYISPEEMGRFRTSVESQFGGIGIQVTMDEGQLKILSPLVGTPAYRAGLLAGDRIVEIDGKPTEGLSLDEAVQRLKGKEGTQVKLSVIHPAQTAKQEVTITRELIRVETVLGDRHKPDDTWDFLIDHEKRIGYVRVTAFGRDTVHDLRKALEDLRKEKSRGLILDLRFNPGGLLNSAIEVSDLFISSGRIVSTQGRNSPERAWEATKSGSFEGFPMVVLVNRYTASAAEIVAACLQDHKRAAVLGERTWGKGSVQNVVELEEGRSALKLTTAAYRRPSGKNIHRFPGAKDTDEWGVMADKGLDLKLDDREMLDLVQDRRQRDIVLPHPPQPSPGPVAPVPKPAEKAPPKPPAAKPPAAKPESEGKPAVPGGAAPPKPEAGKFVDRQLQKAIDHLGGELARAK